MRRVALPLARAGATVLPALLALALLLPGLGAAPFDDPGEGQQAEIAREAWLSGDWLTLRLNGVRYFDKPPLLYATAATAFSIWGLSEWAARLGPLAGAVLAVTATALLGVRLLGPAGGLAAGIALSSCALFAAFGRYVRPETLFVAAIQWGVTGFALAAVAADEPARRRWLLLGCGALGLAALAKDPLGLVGPLAAVALALALAGRLRWLAARLPVGGVILLIGLGLGWYVLAAVANAGFLWYTVVDNHLLNAARLRHFPDEDVPLAAAEFVLIAVLGAFPWAIAAGLMVARLVRRRAWRDPAETPWVALALWSVGTLVVFAIVPFRLPYYGLPMYPALALLAARWWMEARSPGRAWLGVHLAAFAALALACGVAALGDGHAFSRVVMGATDVATRKGEAARAMPPAVPWDALGGLVGRAALIFATGAAGLAIATVRGAPRLGLAVTLAAMTASVPLVEAALALVASGRAVNVMAAEVARRAGPGHLVLHEGPIEQSGALELYSGRRPVLVEATRSVLGFGARFPDAAESFWGAERFRREWLSDRPLLLVTPRSPERSVIAAMPADRRQLLLAHNGRRLYGNGATAR
ncbi:MAG TPA: glycosyltransferase family 39 protein [Candidatus Limnocylindrales bacterium]|nr:glycosyltransferase family 39 protein [Candidatus Limnocylindrales bacterium]